MLKEFLKIHGSEVLNMLLEEWNMDDALAVAREEGREDGREEGWEKGHVKGSEEGWEKCSSHVIELLDQGLTVEEIKERLTRTTTN